MNDQDMIQALTAERDLHKEESERAWKTLIALAEKLNIDDLVARDMPGKPSDVFMAHIAKRDAYVAERTAHEIDIAILTGIADNHIYNAPSAQEATDHIASLLRVEVEKRIPNTLRGS